MGQGNGTTDVLVSLTSIDAQTEVSLDGLVELGGVELLDELDSLKGGVERGAVDLLGSGVIALTMLSHVHYLLWLNGREPSHIVSCALLHTFNGRPGWSTRHYLKKSLLSDGDAHGAGGTGDDLLGGINVVGIEVRHLDLES